MSPLDDRPSGSAPLGATADADPRGAPGPERWSDRFYRWRDRLLADPRFQRWATAFPLTRPLVRSRARRLFDLCAGFVYTQVLYACVRLGLLDAVADGPLTTAQLASRSGLSEEATRRLARAATALGLLAARGPDRYGLGLDGAALRANPGVLAMIEHHAILYRDLEDPIALLQGRTTPRLSQYWAYTGDRPSELSSGEVTDYSALMAASQPLVAEEILDAYAFDRHARVLDIGGGTGAFLAALAVRAPRPDLTLFDLPAVVEQGRARFERLGLGHRLTPVGGSFHTDPLPEGADVATLVRVLYDHDDTAVATILARARAALPPGGTVLVAEPMAGVKGAEAMGDAYFGFYLLAMRGGLPRTPERIAELLVEAGFEHPRVVRTRRPLFTGVVTARVPKAAA